MYLERLKASPAWLYGCAVALTVVFIYSFFILSLKAATLYEQPTADTLGQSAADHQTAVPGFGLPVQTLGTGLSGSVSSIAYKLHGAAVADDLAAGYGDVYIVSCPTSGYSGCIFQTNSAARTIVSQSGNDAVVNASFATPYTFNPGLYYFLLFVTDHDLAVWGSATDAYGSGEAKWFESDGIYTSEPTIADVAFTICDASSCDLAVLPPADTTPPSLTVTSGSANTSSQTIAGTTDDTVAVSVDIAGAYFVASPISGSWSVSTNLLDGDYTINASSTDLAGNTGFATGSFVVDTTTPTIVITGGPAEGSTVTTNSVTFTFSVNDAHPGTTDCAFDGAPLTSCTSPQSATLADGAHTFTAASTDALGNTSSIVRHFSIDTTPPPPPPPTNPTCILTLGGSGAGILLSGSASIKATGCGTQVNSASIGALDISGATKLQSLKNCLVGTLKKSGSASVSPSPVPCSTMTDPFVSIIQPSVGSCDYTNYSTSGAKTVTLSPGVYCGGIKFSGSTKATFLPGIYVLKNGPLQTSGSTHVTGNDVSLYLTGSQAALSFSGSTNLQLSAPQSGMLSGFVVYAHASSATVSTASGSSNLKLSGIVYLPSQTLSLEGSSSLGSTYNAFVVQALKLSGSSNITTTYSLAAPGTPSF